MLSRLPALLGYKILTLFLISSVLRIIAGIFMPLKINPAPSNGVLDPARRINAPSHPRSKLRGFRGRGGIKEVRPVKKVKSNELFFSMIGVKPMLGIGRKVIRY